MAYHQMTSVVDQHLTQDAANYQLSHELVSLGNYVNLETRRSIVHSHPYFEFILVRKGRPEYMTNGSRFPVHPGEMLLIAPGVAHAVFCGPDNAIYERLILQINAGFLTELLRTTGLEARIGAIPPLHVLPADAVLHWDIQGLIGRINSTRSVRDAELREKLYRSQVSELMLIIEYISKTERAAAAPTSTSALIADVTCFIQERFRDSELTVARIAQSSYVSREHLARTFKEYTGETISHYLTDLRMQEFRYGLIQGKSILQACMESGFSDYSSFVKSFRKRYGITPMEYREYLIAAMRQTEEPS